MPRGKKKTIVSEEIASPFVVTLKIGNETYTSNGATLHDALLSLETPTKMFLKGVLTVIKGDNKRERLLYPAEIRRLVRSSPGIKRVYAKQLTAIMK